MSRTVLAVRDLKIAFPGGVAVDGVDLTVERGEVVALVGEPGSGTTTIARAVLGLLPRTAMAAGSVRLDDVEVLDVSAEQLNRAAVVFEDPRMVLDPMRTVGRQIAAALRAHGPTTRRAARARAVELLDLVGVPDPRYHPHELSDGARRRVVVALALAGNPALLVADEPAVALDVTVRAEILALLREVRDHTGVGILIATRDPEAIAGLADRVVLVHHGRVVERQQADARFGRRHTRATI